MDKRGQPVALSEVQIWWPVPGTEFKIGVAPLGEFRMDSEAARLVIFKSDESYINFGQYSFYIPSLHAGHLGGDPFIVSPNGALVILNWLTFYKHAHLVPVAVHPILRRFAFVDPSRWIHVRKFVSEDPPVVLCTERIVSTRRTAKEISTSREIPPLRPIEEFFAVNPATLNLRVLGQNAAV